MKRVIEVFDRSKYVAIIDFRDAYYHMKIKEEYRHKTAFEFKGQDLAEGHVYVI